jgi:hypothetical protein
MTTIELPQPVPEAIGILLKSRVDRNRNQSEPYSFGVTGTAFRIRFRLQESNTNDSEKLNQNFNPLKGLSHQIRNA